MSSSPLPPQCAARSHTLVSTGNDADVFPPPRTRTHTEGPGHPAPQRRSLRWDVGDASNVCAHRGQLPVQPARLPHRRGPQPAWRGDWPRPRLPAGRPLHQGAR
eukprot:1137613-Pelagomonas_calceolata.AAC.12